MNKQCYRVVFNKARGMFMVVSEITKSQNKTAGNGSSKKSTAKSELQSGTTLSYSRLAVAILCCQSMIYTQVQAANTQIQNTASNVPDAQRAPILREANGTPTVNIRTPNSKGLSHNTYNQFDIGSNGAILNNSIGGATTQLAGDIKGNPFLAQGVANTILNEVRSNAPAKFQGNLEIAGQRADVIIASPSGLQIQGGGFINANQATLTTGTPKIDSAGNLTGFDVKQGQIQFDNAATGNALGGALYDGKNKNQANYVDILARAVTINGQIHANQDVDMVIGSNTVDYDTGAATKITGTGTAPTLAVDVSTLGGIYANSINLVGTENGLGVRNAGNIQANQQIVLTNSGKIENKGDIKTTKAQTSLLSINATGNAGSIDHSGTISSYGMIDMQADKDITLDAGIVKKNSAGTAVQLMPDIIRIDAGGSLKVSNISDIRNKNVDDQTNIYTHSTLDTIVDSKSAIASNGGVSIDGDRYVHLLDTSSTSAGVAALNIRSKSGTTVDNATIAGSGDVYINSRTADTTVSNNSQLSAKKSLTIGAGRDATLKTGSRIIGANDLTIAATRNATVDTAGSIKVTNDAVLQAGELAYLKNISQPTNIGKQLIIQGKQATVLNSTANANEGIYINSQGKDTTITNSNLNSTKGAVTAIANQAALNINKLNTNANSTILAATGDVSIVGSKLTTDNIAIESGQNLTATQLTTVNKDIKQTGSINTKSKGTTDITSSQLKNTGNISVNSDKYLTIIDTDIDSGKNLSLLSKQRFYSNTRSDENAEGKNYTNYNVNTKQNKFTASDVLTVDSNWWQTLNKTDFKGSTILINTDSGHSLSDNLNLTATGASINVDKNVNGNIQLVNKGTIALDQRHTITAQNDLVIQADKGIKITKMPKIVAQNIALKTTVASTAKNDKGIDNTFGDGDISIVGTELSATGSTDNALVIDAANHLNVINSQTKSVGSTTMKSGNLMRLNNSEINAGKHLAIDTKNQLITNGERYANNSGTEEAPKWSNGWRNIAGDTVLHADEIVSINSRWAQLYQNTDITGGAIIVNSGSTLTFNKETTINATGNTKLAKNTTKLSDGKAANTLNGDLILNSTAGNLTIDPNKVTLAATGDATLAARGGKLHLRGFKGTKGLGSEKVVKLTAGGDISLSGKEVVVEGSDLVSKKGFSGSNVVLVDGKSVPTAGISITATDGSVKLKGVKNSFNNYTSPQKITILEERIRDTETSIANISYDESILAGVSNFYGFKWPAIYYVRDQKGLDAYMATTAYIEAENSKKNKESLQTQLVDLKRILEVSRKPAAGFEHKTASLKAGKDININAEQGLLIEASNITSNNGDINLFANGNLPTEIIISTDTTSGETKTSNGVSTVSVAVYNNMDINRDSLVITSLADEYQYGPEGGANSSSHSMIVNPMIHARNNINIIADGNQIGNLDPRTNTNSQLSNPGLQLTGDSIVINGNVSISDYSVTGNGFISGDNLKVHAVPGNAIFNNNTLVINGADIISDQGKVTIHNKGKLGSIHLLASQEDFQDNSYRKYKKGNIIKRKTITETKKYNDVNAVTTDIIGNNIDIRADGDVIAIGSDLQTHKQVGDIKINAGKILKLYTVDEISESDIDITKKSSFAGVKYNSDHTNDTRKQITQLPTKLISDKVITRSGYDTILKGTVFKTLNPADIKVSVGDYADPNAKVIFEAALTQISTTHNQEKESTVWQKTVEKWDTVTTAQLPKFNQTPTMTGPDGKFLNIEIPVDVDISGNNKAKTTIQKSQKELGKIALNLSKQPGYEYLAELDKKNEINWAQVNLIQEHYEFEQEGLTPAGIALITLAVAWAAGPAATSISSSLGGAVGTAAGAGFSSLTTQAAIALANNKGNLTKTVEDMASSKVVRTALTTALTAGTLEYINTSVMPNVFKSLSIENAKSLQGRLVNGVFEGTTSALVNTGINGGSLSDNLELALLNNGIDAIQGSVAGKIKLTENQYLLHKILHAVAGCAASIAKRSDCEAGAIGAGVGEMIVEWLPEPDPNMSPSDYNKALNNQRNMAKLLVGALTAYSGYDASVAAGIADISISNNRQLHKDEQQLAAKLYERAVKLGQNISYKDIQNALRTAYYNNGTFNEKPTDNVQLAAGAPRMDGGGLWTSYKGVDKQQLVFVNLDVITFVIQNMSAVGGNYKNYNWDANNMILPSRITSTSKINDAYTPEQLKALNSAILNNGGSFIGSNTAYEQAQNEKTLNAILTTAEVVGLATGAAEVYQVTKGGRLLFISAKDYLAWRGKKVTASEVLNKANEMSIDINTGLKQAKIYSTNLSSQRALNLIDNGSLKPAEAAAGAQLEPILGKVTRYSGTYSSKNPDFLITEGNLKGKTIDVMYTTNKLEPKEIEGLNKFYAKNMAKGEEVNNIKKHLAKADFVPVDFRVLDPTNQKIFLNFIKTLPKNQQNQIIILK